MFKHVAKNPAIRWEKLEKFFLIKVFDISAHDFSTELPRHLGIFRIDFYPGVTAIRIYAGIGFCKATATASDFDHPLEIVGHHL